MPNYPDINNFQPKPFKMGDDIHNSEYCQVGYKFNTKLGRCIPADALVGDDGIVRMAYRATDSNFERNPDGTTVQKPAAPKPPVKETPDVAIKSEGLKRKKANAQAKQLQLRDLV